MSFRSKITLTISTLMFLSLTIFGLFSYIDTKKNSITQVESSLKMASTALTDYIDLWISAKKKGVDSTARSLKDVEVVAISDLIDKLRETSTMLGALDAYMGFEDGRMVWGSGKKQPENYDPRTRPWYIKAKETKKLGMTDAYIGATTKQLMVTIMAPVFNGTDFLGVYGIDIALDDITKVISDFNFNGGYGVLQDTKGLIISHPNKELLGKDLSSLLPELTNQFGTKTEGLINYAFNGANKIYTFKMSSESGWRPGITFDKAAAYTFLDTQIKELLFMGILMLIISIALVTFLIKILIRPLDSLNNVVQELSSSEGDLRQRLNVEHHDEFGAVSGNINRFIEKLHDIVKRAKEISGENASISEELSRTASQVVRNVDAESKIVSSAKEEGLSLTKSIEASVEKAKVSQEVLHKTQKTIEAVKEKVEQLETTMQITANKEQNLADRLNQVSHNANEVKDVLGIIRDIADQTNLLALNAAIEAARAGEHGRGFAVVADEVRKLAERTQKSLVEIDATINVVVQSIMDANTDITENAQEVHSLASISMELQEGMNGISRIIETTMEDTKESVQNFVETSEKISHMVSEIEKINVISKENVFSIDNVSKASEHLHSMTENLNNELGKFKS